MRDFFRKSDIFLISSSMIPNNLVRFTLKTYSATFLSDSISLEIDIISQKRNFHENSIPRHTRTIQPGR